MTFTMEAESLASKWGFGDGDALTDYLYDLVDGGYLERERMPERDAVLVAAVRRWLLPLLDAQGIVYELCVIGSIHNPIRLDVVNGVEVDQYGPEVPKCLVGISVTVAREAILALCQELA